jgi:hypothetical protein
MFRQLHLGIKACCAASRAGGARRLALRALPLAAATSMLALAAPGVPAAVPAVTAGAAPLISHPILIGKQLPAPISTSDCLSEIQIRCYTPVQYRTAYNLNSLYKHGITGKGRTIVIVSRGSWPSGAAARWVHRKAEEERIAELFATTTTPRGPTHLPIPLHRVTRSRPKIYGTRPNPGWPGSAEEEAARELGQPGLAPGPCL